MTHVKMDPIQVQDTPVLLQRSLAPSLKLLGEALVEATDRAGAGRDSQQGVSNFSHLVGARPSHEHLGESLCDMRFIAAVAFKRLSVELALVKLSKGVTTSTRLQNRT